MFLDKIFKDNFLKAGSIVMCGSFLVGGLNYVFNLVMGRMLGPEKFGEIVALMGLGVILGVPSATILRFMTKYSADFKTKKAYSSFASLFYLVNKYSLGVGIIILLLFWALAQSISSSMQIEILPIFIFAFSSPISLAGSVTRGSLLGLQKFIPYSVASIIMAFFKLGLAILLVALGFSVLGVVIALVVSSLISYFYSLNKVKVYLQKNKKGSPALKTKITWSEISPYLSIVFWTSLFLILFSNTDVVLAKLFLSPYLAGQYAALSVTGKIIVYGAGAFVTAMFPMVSAAKANGDGTEKKILINSIGLISALGLFLLGFFIFVPNFVIKMLFGQEYLLIAPYLGCFGIISLLSILSIVLINYFMAANIKTYFYPFVAGVLLQLLLIWRFHANIAEITIDMLISACVIFILMLVTYIRYDRRLSEYK